MVMVKEEETDDNIAGLSENQPTSPPSVFFQKGSGMKGRKKRKTARRRADIFSY